MVATKSQHFHRLPLASFHGLPLQLLSRDFSLIFSGLPSLAPPITVGGPVPTMNSLVRNVRSVSALTLEP